MARRKSTTGGGGRAQMRQRQRAEKKRRGGDDAERRAPSGGGAGSGEGTPSALPPIIFPALLVIAAVVVYANSIAAPFVFDDEIHVVQRQEQIDQLWPPSDVLAGTFRPVVQYSLALNFAIGGLDPAGYHIFNVTIHILAGLALYGVSRRTVLRVFGADRTRASAVLAFVAALMWLVHPLQTQSVTYIIQRGESLASLFYLLTLSCSIRAHDGPRRRIWWWAGAIASCGMGMGSKAIVMTAPIAVLLWDVVFTKPPLRETVVRRLPLYGGLAASWLLMIVTGLFQGVMRTTGEAAGIGFSVKSVAPVEYLFTQPSVLLHYLKLSFWPHPLVIDYQWPPVETLAAGILPGLVIVIMLILTVWAVVKRYWAGFAAALFFLVLAPTSSFVPLKDLCFEHRMYLPLASVIVLTIGLTWWGLQQLRARANLSAATVQTAGLALVVLAAALFGARTIMRNQDYRNPQRLWESALAVNPTNSRALTNLGIDLKEQADRASRQGNGADAPALYERAIERLEAALALQPEEAPDPRVELNLGAALYESGRAGRAVEVLRPLVNREPGFVEAWFNLGLCYADLNQPAAAAEAYGEAFRLRPAATEAGLNYGNMLVTLSRVEESIAVYQRAIDHAPPGLPARVRAIVHFNLGNSYFRLARWNEAVAAYVEAQRIDPTYANVGPALELARRQQAAGGGS